MKAKLLYCECGDGGMYASWGEDARRNATSPKLMTYWSAGMTAKVETFLRTPVLGASICTPMGLMVWVREDAEEDANEG